MTVGSPVGVLRDRMEGLLRSGLRVAIAVLIGCTGFGLFVALVGENPLTAFEAMWRSTVVDSVGPGEVAIAAAPIVLCALAVAVPARAGLWNLGGEGQLIFGVLGATAASVLLSGTMTGVVAVPLVALGGAIAGGIWAAVPALLRVAVNLNEAISSLLLSYVALRVLQYMVHGPWKDPASLGFPQAEVLPESHQLSLIGSGRLHAGVLVALACVAVVWFLVRRTRWGFQLRVVGGNGEAARRAGLPVKRLILTSMVVGGALAGLAGMVQLAGVELQARPAIAGVYGFLGFLVSWLAGHNPVAILAAGLAIAAIVVGGDALQISADLPAASVNILMALVLLAVLGRSNRVRGVEG